MSSNTDKKNAFIARMGDASLIATLVAPMLVAAAAVAALVALIDIAFRWPWYAWATLAPVLYLSWLAVYLSLSVLICRYMGRRWPKPRHVVVRPGESVRPAGLLGLFTATTCYRRLVINETLPLARAAALIPGLNTWLLRTYSPSAQMGREILNLGRITDPDLTEVSDNVVLGAGSSVVAHGMTVREDGSVVYVSAPILIGRRATIGGEAFVSLGCVIGEDAVLEQRSFAPAYTRIPAGEVWGGNPATFRRKRGASIADEAPPLKPESAIRGSVE